MYASTRNTPVVNAKDEATKAVELEKLKSALSAASVNHTETMYANAQLLKAIKYASIAFLIGAAGLIYISWRGSNSGNAPAAPAAPPVTPPPIVIPPTV